MNLPVNNDATMRRSFWIEGPRWAGIATALKKSAFTCPDLTLTLKEDKHWLSTTVYVTVEGPPALVAAFMRGVKKMIDEYEQR